MILYPTIELQNGRCVSLTQGKLDEPLVWHVDPVEKAQEFVAAGAEWMQVTDFDAVAGTGSNADIVEEIIRAVGIPVQVAGGIRSREQAEDWIEKGAGRVVIGTFATYDPETVKALAYQHPDQIVLSIDVWQGSLMTEGWKTASALQPETFLQAFENTPFAAILLTDIDSDVSESDASLSMITGLAGTTRTPVIASGIVRSVDDVSRLKYMGNVHGALLARALFRKTIDLTEALAAARPEQELTAEFI